MTWTTPKTWAVDELVTATIMNTHVRDNLNALKAPPTAHYELDGSANYTTTSTSFADVDATNLALTVTTTGGDVLIGFTGSVRSSINDGSYGRVYFDVSLDGTRIAGDDGMCVELARYTFDDPAVVSFVWLCTGVSADSHIFKLQWKVLTGTATLLAGAGTSNHDVHGQFWVREVS